MQSDSFGLVPMLTEAEKGENPEHNKQNQTIVLMHLPGLCLILEERSGDKIHQCPAIAQVPDSLLVPAVIH
jgi:hypothetical protein